MGGAEAERRRKEEAERRAKLDEIAEKQRQRERELEEKERLRREALLGKSTEAPPKAVELPSGGRPLESGAPAAAAAAVAPAPGKYVPRFKREGPGLAAPAEPDRWGKHDDRAAPAGDRWRGDDRKSGFGGATGQRSSTWSSTRYPSRG